MSGVKGAKKTDFLALVSAKAEQVLPTMEGPPPLREGEEAVTVVFEHKGPLGMSLQLIAADGGLDNAGVWATGGRVLLSAGSGLLRGLSAARGGDEPSRSRSHAKGEDSASRGRRFGAGAGSEASTPSPSRSATRSATRGSHSRGTGTSGTRSPSPGTTTRDGGGSSTRGLSPAPASAFGSSSGFNAIGAAMPPPDVAVSYVKISGGGAGTQAARALGVRVGDRVLSVASRGLGPTPGASSGGEEDHGTGAVCHPLTALRWRRGLGGAALTKALAGLPRPVTLVLARTKVTGIQSTVSQEEAAKVTKHARQTMGNTLASARAAWEDRVSAANESGGPGGPGGSLSTPRPTEAKGPEGAAKWTQAMHFKARRNRRTTQAQRAAGQGNEVRGASPPPVDGPISEEPGGGGSLPAGGVLRNQLAARIAARKRAGAAVSASADRPAGPLSGLRGALSNLRSRGANSGGGGGGGGASGAGSLSRSREAIAARKLAATNRASVTKAGRADAGGGGGGGGSDDDVEGKVEAGSDSDDEFAEAPAHASPSGGGSQLVGLGDAVMDDLLDDALADEWRPDAEQAAYDRTNARANMGAQLAKEKSEWALRALATGADGSVPGTTVAVGPSFAGARVGTLATPFNERFLGGAENRQVNELHGRDLMGTTLALAKDEWLERVRSEGGGPTTTALAPAMERRGGRRAPQEKFVEQGALMREQELRGRSVMASTLEDAKKEWDARTSVSVDSAGVMTTVRATTTALAPAMERRYGPRVLPEKFLAQGEKEEELMVKARVHMQQTLVAARSEWHGRGAATVVKEGTSFSGLAGKSAPVWNSATGKWERRAFGVKATGSTTLEKVAEVQSEKWVEKQVLGDKCREKGREAMSDALAAARDKWKKDREKSHVTRAAAPAMERRAELANMALYGYAPQADGPPPPPPEPEVHVMTRAEKIAAAWKAAGLEPPTPGSAGPRRARSGSPRSRPRNGGEGAGGSEGGGGVVDGAVGGGSSNRRASTGDGEEPALAGDDDDGAVFTTPSLGVAI